MDISIIQLLIIIIRFMISVSTVKYKLKNIFEFIMTMLINMVDF